MEEKNFSEGQTFVLTIVIFLVLFIFGVYLTLALEEPINGFFTMGEFQRMVSDSENSKFLEFKMGENDLIFRIEEPLYSLETPPLIKGDTYLLRIRTLFRRYPKIVGISDFDPSTEDCGIVKEVEAKFLGIDVEMRHTTIFSVSTETKGELSLYADGSTRKALANLKVGESYIFFFEETVNFDNELLSSRRSILGVGY
jgi:hypothetical protein